MKKKILKILLPAKEYIPHLMLILILSSIMIASFHNHDCNDISDNCAICRFQQSFSSVTIESTFDGIILQYPLSESIVTLNENATDPSQRIICFSHAPPLYFL